LQPPGAVEGKVVSHLDPALEEGLAARWTPLPLSVLSPTPDLRLNAATCISCTPRPPPHSMKRSAESCPSANMTAFREI
jgi:hypothetical protein